MWTLLWPANFPTGHLKKSQPRRVKQTIIHCSSLEECSHSTKNVTTTASGSMLYSYKVCSKSHGQLHVPAILSFLENHLFYLAPWTKTKWFWSSFILTTKNCNKNKNHKKFTKLHCQKTQDFFTIWLICKLLKLPKIYFQGAQLYTM